MNWNEYLELSEKTLSDEFHSGRKAELLLHAVIGSLTEIEELLENHTEDESDETNRGEELGDIFWYIAIIAREYNIQVHIGHKIESSLMNPMDVVLNATKKLLKMLDILKKKIYYNKVMDDSSMIRYTNDVISLLFVYANIFDIDVQKSLDINIAKLKARYGEKFSSDRAINRDLVTEREILEGKAIV